MHRLLSRALPLLLAAVALAAAARVAGQTVTSDRPRLVVLVSVDQFRADYLQRLHDGFLPARTGTRVGGFRFLQEQGTSFLNATYSHIPTATGPGHATMLTGSVPALTGIIGNEWFDPGTGASVYCVDDPAAHTIGGPSKPRSARNLLVTTLGDELKLATDGAARVVSISLKDRAAILMGGHAADLVLWLDAINGAWVTSTYYTAHRPIPVWVESLNMQHRPDAELDRVWTPLLPVAHPFTHPTRSDGPERYRRWVESGFAQQYLFDTVKEALREERLGADDVPDLLTINVATNDYVGHTYGPYSAEVRDAAMRTDRQLSALFNEIASVVPGGLSNTLILVTADHGVADVPERARDTFRLPSVRIEDGAVERAVETRLDTTFGDETWVDAFKPPHLYLRRHAIAARHAHQAAVERAAADAVAALDGVFTTATRSQIVDGRLPDTAWGRAVANSFNPQRSGDVLVIEAPGTVWGAANATSHGTPWAYDRHVPLLAAGFGVRRAAVSRPVDMTGLAPTLAEILRVAEPSGSVGEPLAELLER